MPSDALSLYPLLLFRLLASDSWQYFLCQLKHNLETAHSEGYALPSVAFDLATSVQKMLSLIERIRSNVFVVEPFELG